MEWIEAMGFCLARNRNLLVLRRRFYECQSTYEGVITKELAAPDQMLDGCSTIDTACVIG
jgi:hypothetical protein